MTTSITMFSFIFLFAFLISVKGLFDSELLAQVTLSFTKKYHVSCIQSLYNEKLTSEEKFEIYKVQEILIKNSKRTCGTYTFGKYNSLQSSDYFVYHKNSCFKPMKLVFANREGKSEFTQLTLQYPMADSIWLVFLNTSIEDFFDGGKLPFNAQLISVTVINSDLVQLHEIYRVHYGFPIRVNYFGNWTRDHDLRVINGHIYTRRTDLEGKLFRTGSIENWPMSYYENGHWDGYYLRIWHILQGYINCTSVHLESADLATGIELADGTWNGLVAMILRDEIDVTLMEMNINEERSKVLDFARPLFFSRHQVFFRQPGNQLEWTSVLRPFSLDIWLTIIIWIIIAGLTISFCYKLSQVEIHMKSEHGIIPGFFFILQSICQQGSKDIPRSASCRIVFFFAYLLPTIIIPSYSASLISSLTYKTPAKPFDSLEEMLQDGTYKLLVPNNTAEYLQFSKSTIPLYQEIFKKLLVPVPEKDLYDLDNYAETSLLCKGSKYAIYMVEGIFNMKLAKTKSLCKITSLTQPLDNVQQSMGLPKNSPFTGLINYHLLKMYETGIIKRIQMNLWLKAAKSNLSNYEEVGLQDIFQIFIFLLLAIVVSACMCVIEQIIARRLIIIRKIDKNLSKNELSKETHITRIHCFTE